MAISINEKKTFIPRIKDNVQPVGLISNPVAILIK